MGESLPFFLVWGVLEVRANWECRFVVALKHHLRSESLFLCRLNVYGVVGLLIIMRGGFSLLKRRTGDLLRGSVRSRQAVS